MISLGSCSHCHNPAPFLNPLCRVCQDDFDRECRRDPPDLSLLDNSRITGALVHEGVIRSLFSRAKFRGDRQAMRLLLRQGLSRLALPLHRVCLLPVPPHRDRMLRRGGSLADQVAFSWARTLGIPYSFGGVSGKGDQESKRLGQRERESLSLKDRWVIGNLRFEDPVVLVDDLATTGWTLRTLAQGLRERGVQVEGAIVLCLRPRYDRGIL